MDDLTLKEQRFIEFYTDVDNKATYGNGTESYVQTYGTTNRDSAGVLANRLLGKVKIKSRIEALYKGCEINIEKHLLTLDRKLDYLAKKPNLCKEEISSFRFLAELRGMIGARNAIAIQFNMHEGQECPTCKREYYKSDLNKISEEELNDKIFNILLKRYTPEEAVKQIEKRRGVVKVDYI